MILVLITELGLLAFLNLPPSLEQLSLGISNPFILWTSRIAGLLLLILLTHLVSKKLVKQKSYFWLFILISPTFSLLYASFPLDIFKLFLIFLVCYSATRAKGIAFGGVLAVVTILVLNLAIFNQKPQILETLSLKAPKEEVALRFHAEDNLKPNIYIPLSLRRVAYNKYFLAVKNLANQSLVFLNPETLFFQEVHPTHQKAQIMFFWPTVFIFCIGIWGAVKKEGNNSKNILILSLIAYLYFITTNASIERRLALLLWPTAMVLSTGVQFSLSSRSQTLKLVTISLITLSLYGWVTNVYDRYVRPGYWYDNRPMAYKFVFDYLKNYKEEYKGVQVPDTLYAAKEYCKFYLDDCSKVSIKNFDFSKESFEGNVIYVGFTGNFVGPHPENNFQSDISNQMDIKGLKVLTKNRTHDNIANTFGQDLYIIRGK